MNIVAYTAISRPRNCSGERFCTVVFVAAICEVAANPTMNSTRMDSQKAFDCEKISRHTEQITDMAAKPETAVHPNFNEKTPKHRVIGPASYAIDGNEDTGWSSDLGPGRLGSELQITTAWRVAGPLDQLGDAVQPLDENAHALERPQLGAEAVLRRALQ